MAQIERFRKQYFMRKNIKYLFYWLARSLGLFAISRRLYAKSVIILCYHGGSFGDEWLYNPKLFVRKEFFEKRVDWILRKKYKVIPLNDLMSESFDKKGQRRVVITFDDGWASTGDQLIPVLNKNGLPSVLYLSTKKFEEALPLYNVAIRYLLSKRNHEISFFEIDLDGKSVAYDVTSNSDIQRLISNFQIWVDRTSATSANVYEKLNQISLALQSSAGELVANKRQFEYLSAEELMAVSKMNCSIELHGHVHMYPLGDPQEFDKDIGLCKDSILSLGLPSPKHYCYPSGSFDDCARDVLIKNGVFSATICRPGLIRTVEEKNRYCLPRFLDGEDVSFLEFEAEMSGFAGLLRFLVGSK